MHLLQQALTHSLITNYQLGQEFMIKRSMTPLFFRRSVDREMYMDDTIDRTTCKQSSYMAGYIHESVHAKCETYVRAHEAPRFQKKKIQGH